MRATALRHNANTTRACLWLVERIALISSSCFFFFGLTASTNATYACYGPGSGVRDPGSGVRLPGGTIPSAAWRRGEN